MPPKSKPRSLHQTQVGSSYLRSRDAARHRLRWLKHQSYADPYAPGFALNGRTKRLAIPDTVNGVLASRQPAVVFLAYPAEPLGEELGRRPLWEWLRNRDRRYGPTSCPMELRGELRVSLPGIIADERARSGFSLSYLEIMTSGVLEMGLGMRACSPVHVNQIVYQPSLLAGHLVQFLGIVSDIYGSFSLNRKYLLLVILRATEGAGLQDTVATGRTNVGGGTCAEPAICVTRQEVGPILDESRTLALTFDIASEIALFWAIGTPEGFRDAREGQVRELDCDRFLRADREMAEFAGTM